MRLLLYGTDHCHLCDEAENLIYRALEGRTYELSKVDISESDALMEKYALSIPVLALEQSKASTLNWPFNEADVVSFITLPV
jgi:predicted DCC family thiol-disulfide oxidoreductase YuxK